MDRASWPFMPIIVHYACISEFWMYAYGMPAIDKDELMQMEYMGADKGGPDL